MNKTKICFILISFVILASPFSHAAEPITHPQLGLCARALRMMGFDKPRVKLTSGVELSQPYQSHQGLTRTLPVLNPVLISQNPFYKGTYLTANANQIALVTASNRGDDSLEPAPKYDHNEDAIALIPHPPDYHTETIVLADGMGGHGSGGIASKVAISTFAKLKDNYPSEVVGNIPEALSRRFQDERARGNSVSADMGTTILVAEIQKGNVIFSHIGDSRAGVFRKGKIVALTKDHSLVSDLGLSEYEAMHHPDNNIVTQALKIKNGRAEPAHIPTQTSVDLKTGDIIVMASDGLWDFVQSTEVAQVTDIRTENDPAKMRDTLLGLVAQRVGDDNISIVVIRYHGI